ncbi:hypothetical protein CH063_10171, partial [Colletotrichum higginsianum]
MLQAITAIAAILIFASISPLSLPLENHDFFGALQMLLRGLQRWIGCRGWCISLFPECLALFVPWTSTTADGRQDEAHWKQGTTQQLRPTHHNLTSSRPHNSLPPWRQPRWETRGMDDFRPLSYYQEVHGLRPRLSTPTSAVHRGIPMQPSIEHLGRDQPSKQPTPCPSSSTRRGGHLGVPYVPQVGLPTNRASTCWFPRLQLLASPYGARSPSMDIPPPDQAIHTRHVESPITNTLPALLLTTAISSRTSKADQ